MLFRSRRIAGPITMLNLLRFRAWADDTAFPDAAPAEAISGRDAHERYMDHTMPFLTATGGSAVFLARTSHRQRRPARRREPFLLRGEAAEPNVDRHRSPFRSISHCQEIGRTRTFHLTRPLSSPRCPVAAATGLASSQKERS